MPISWRTVKNAHERQDHKKGHKYGGECFHTSFTINAVFLKMPVRGEARKNFEFTYCAESIEFDSQVQVHILGLFKYK